MECRHHCCYCGRCRTNLERVCNYNLHGELRRDTRVGGWRLERLFLPQILDYLRAIINVVVVGGEVLY